jgi:hypothetical protein
MNANNSVKIQMVHMCVDVGAASLYIKIENVAKVCNSSSNRQTIMRRKIKCTPDPMIYGALVKLCIVMKYFYCGWKRENEIMKTQWFCMCSALNIQNVHIIIPIIMDIIENPDSPILENFRVSNLTFSDVNECFQPNNCSQLCNNTLGSYECYCRLGFKVSPNATTDCIGTLKRQIIWF